MKGLLDSATNTLNEYDTPDGLKLAAVELEVK